MREGGATTHKHECLALPDPGPRIGRHLPPVLPTSVEGSKRMASQASFPRLAGGCVCRPHSSALQVPDGPSSTPSQRP